MRSYSILCHLRELLFFYLLTISLLAWIVADDVNQLTVIAVVGGGYLLFYGFIASLLWELLFHFIHLKTFLRGGIFYLFLGIICGGLVAVVTDTADELNVNVTGWIASMSIMGIGAFVFYAIRRIPHKYS